MRNGQGGPRVAEATTPTTRNRTGGWRFERPAFVRRLAPCAGACPAGEDIPRIELLVGRGAVAEAWHLIREQNPFPAVCGRVCAHDCEASCNRGDYDEPVSIRSLERHVADQARARALKPRGAKPATGRTVGIVGAGPAGLTAAHYLASAGHAVELFDAREEAGGALRYAIPDYRLPKDVLAWEAELALDGVRFHPRRRLGGDLRWEELARYDALFLALGAWRPARLGIEGEELAAAGPDLLEAVREGRAQTVCGPVAVIGGGNTAMDVARVLLRLGGEPTIYYRRRQEDLPALPEEVEEALEEGVELRTLLAPAKLERRAEGGFRLFLRPMAIAAAAGEPRPPVLPSGEALLAVDVEAVYAAAGGVPSEGLPAEAHWTPAGPHLLRLEPDPAARGTPPVFLGGDLANARRTVVNAVASGKAAAAAIHALLQAGAPELSFASSAPRGEDPVIGLADLNPAYFDRRARRAARPLPLGARRTSFDEVRRGLSSSAAVAEARRCFHCGLCDQCDNCHRFCPDVSVLRDLDAGLREIDYEHCKGCGICAEECPRGAIALVRE